MKQRTLLLSLLLLMVGAAFGQTPKWVEKAKGAVFSVVTYGEDGKILNTGNGFFVSEDGVALSDYSLFKNASSAVIITSAGVQMPVTFIMGANDMYDVIKFRVGITAKKVPALTVATTTPAVDAPVYLLPYSTQKDRTYTMGRVNAVDKVENGYSYYTLDLRLKEKMVSCPLMTAEGEVFGLAQKASGQDTATICYAVAADYVLAQNINALGYNDRVLNTIGIKKALPEAEEQALVFLYMASTQLPADKYMVVLNDFIAQYPESADGYLRRANQQLTLSLEAESLDRVSADMDMALKVSKVKDEAYYQRAKMIYSYALTAPATPYKDWTYDRALKEVAEAKAIQSLPVYTQLEGDINYAKQDYAQALVAYEAVNLSEMASAATFYSTAQTKRMLQAPAEEVLALLDSCVARFTQPYTAEAAPYLWERAQARMEAGQPRQAMLDYDAYFKALNGQVNDVFYYYREQSALKGRQYQRALDDIAKAIELNPAELTYRAEQAVVNLRVGRNEEAMASLQEALKLDANYAEGYRLMGIVQLQMKKNKEACESFAKAKALGDESVDALIEKHCK